MTAAARVTPAQQRVLDFLLADTTGDFIIVPPGVCNTIATFNRLESLGLIEQEWRPVSLPPGSYDSFYRAVRS